MDPYGLFILEPVELMRLGLRSVFQDVAWARIVGEASDEEQAIALVRQQEPDLVIFDPTQLLEGGGTFIKALREGNESLKVLALTEQDSEECVYGCLEAGVDGYVVKEASCAELVLGAQAVLKGKTFLSSGVLGGITRGYVETQGMKRPEVLIKSLTPREYQLLRLVGMKRRNHEIAEELSISVKTVEKHRAGMMRKLSLGSPAEVRAFWAKYGEC